MSRGECACVLWDGEGGMGSIDMFGNGCRTDGSMLFQFLLDVGVLSNSFAKADVDTMLAQPLAVHFAVECRRK